ncbi:MAG: ABC transporter substrate-binding protein [Anaerolinea sp.]|nr:ABC transporter substrate-binding protein [Anaerolinea sp.]
MKLTPTLRNLFAFVLITTLLLSGCARSTPTPAEMPTLRIAVLPIIDTLPMYVAQQEGLFTKYNVKVEFVPVGSAPERDQVLAAGQADGTVNELLSVFFFNKDSVQMQVVSYALVPTATSPHFFILASAQSGITRPEELKNVPIGVSQGTIIEYVNEGILTGQGLQPTEIQTVAVPKISDRMALLSSGELKAAVMPDPLAALAVQQGAVIVADDAAYPQYGFSVISFRKAVIDQNPTAIAGFLAALKEAKLLLSQKPDSYKNLLSEQKLVPEPLIASYTIPYFSTSGVPSEAEWNLASDWAIAKGLINTRPAYAEAINGGYLPVP